MMLTIKEYMKRTGVTKKKYVLDWMDNNLIPGAVCKEGEYYFPNSARRPYKARTTKHDAETIRASIVNACRKRQHVTKGTFNLTEGEFNGFIEDLSNSGLIVKRVEDGITYYDSTRKSDELRKNSFSQLVSEVNKTVQATAAVGAVTTSAITVISALL